MLPITQAAAGYWADHLPPGRLRKVIVGYDRRFLSDRFGQRVAEVFLGNDFKVVLTSVPAPTPAVSLAVRDQQAVGGVMMQRERHTGAIG